MRLEVLDGDGSWDEIVPLVKLVYPSEVLATIVWRDVTWANADRRVVLYEDEQAVAVTSMYMRECLYDGAPMRRMVDDHNCTVLPVRTAFVSAGLAVGAQRIL